MPPKAPAASSSMSTPLKSSTNPKRPDTVHNNTLFNACSVSAVRLKFHTDAAAPKHITMWNHTVTPSGAARKVPECAGSFTGHCRYALRRSRPKTLSASA